MSTTAFIRICAVLTVATLLAAQRLPAQQSNQPKACAAGSATEAAGSSEAAAKAKIMASDAWKQMAAEYQKWLNSQAIYTPDDINRINAKLAAQVQSMPAADMQDYLNDWNAKLKVLNGKDFQDAQQWLGEYMSALTDGYRAKTLKQMGLTDVANMTADQLASSIETIRADRLSIQRSQVAFNQMRQQQVQSMQQANAATQKAATARGRAVATSQFNTVQSPYRPSSGGPWNPAPQVTVPQFYVSGSGQIGYMLPF